VFCASRHATATRTVRYFALQVLDSQYGNGQLLVKAYRRDAKSKVNTVCNLTDVKGILYQGVWLVLQNCGRHGPFFVPSVGITYFTAEQ